MLGRIEGTRDVPPPPKNNGGEHFCRQLSSEHVSGAENGAERAKTRVERSGAVSGSQKNRAERSGA